MDCKGHLPGSSNKPQASIDDIFKSFRSVECECCKIHVMYQHRSQAERFFCSSNCLPQSFTEKISATHHQSAEGLQYPVAKPATETTNEPVTHAANETTSEPKTEPVTDTTDSKEGIENKKPNSSGKVDAVGKNMDASMAKPEKCAFGTNLEANLAIPLPISTMLEEMTIGSEIMQEDGINKLSEQIPTKPVSSSPPASPNLTNFTIIPIGYTAEEDPIVVIKRYTILTHPYGQNLKTKSEVYITHKWTRNRYFVAGIDQKLEGQALKDIITEEYNSCTSLNDKIPLMGEILITENISGERVRGVVRTVNPVFRTVGIQCVDYGDRFVNNFSKLRIPTEGIMKFPILGAVITLAKVEPKPGMNYIDPKLVETYRRGRLLLQLLNAADELGDGVEVVLWTTDYHIFNNALLGIE